MAGLVLRYLALGVAVLVLNFALPRLLPGDPLAGDPANGTPALSASQAAQVRATYHLDQPLPQQFLAYADDLLHGDLGWSISRAAPVSQLIEQRLPWTLALVLTSS